MNHADFSKDRKYRYTLWRKWENLFSKNGTVVFIGLNPSTADETNDDPTIRRCVNYTKLWGYSKMCMLNLFAYRATLPKNMMAAVNPIGDENDFYIKHITKNAKVVVAMWGTYGAFLNRGKEVKKMVTNLHYLRLTKSGHPGHCLYLPKNLKPAKWVE
jgi:hypothetical protein